MFRLAFLFIIMANICNNEFYAESNSEETLNFIEKFLADNFEVYDINVQDFYIEAWFESKWTFPEEKMGDMYEQIPDKTDLYMRCLSVEYGCDYVDYHKCDEDGWYQV